MQTQLGEFATRRNPVSIDRVTLLLDRDQPLAVQAEGHGVPARGWAPDWAE